MFLIRAETSGIEHVHEAMKKINCLGPSLNLRGGHGPPSPHYSYTYVCLVKTPIMPNMSHWRPP